eukprot:tig00000459_g1133.t1
MNPASIKAAASAASCGQPSGAFGAPAQARSGEALTSKSGTGNPAYVKSHLWADLEFDSFENEQTAITAMPAYAKKSFEELRWEDHRIVEKGITEMIDISGGGTTPFLSARKSANLIHSLQKAHSSLKIDLAEASRKIETLEKEVSKMKQSDNIQHVIKLESEIDRIKHENGALAEKVRLAAVEITELKKKVEIATKEKELVSLRCQRQEAHLKRAVEDANSKQQTGAAAEQLQRVTAELAEARAEADRLTEDLANTVRQREAALTQKDQQIAALTEQLDKAVQEKEKALEAARASEREREQAQEARDRAQTDARQAAERQHKAEKEAESHKSATNKEREDAVRNIRTAGAKFKKAVEERDAARAEAERLRAQLAEAERVVQETFEQQAQASSEGPKRQSAPAKKLQADLNAAQLARSKAEQACAKGEEEKRAMACQIAELEEDARKREQTQRPLHEKLRALRESQAILLKLFFEHERKRALKALKLPKPKSAPTIKLKVSRSTEESRLASFDTAFAAYERADPRERQQLADAFSHVLEVTFAGETGVDQSGLSREFFRLFFADVERLRAGPAEDAPLLLGRHSAGRGRLPIAAALSPSSSNSKSLKRVAAGTDQEPPTKHDKERRESDEGVSDLRAKYRFIGVALARALATRLLDPGEVDPLPPSLVPLVPLLAGREPAACTAAEALALWEPFLDPQVHRTLAAILSDPFRLAAEGKDTVIPMEGFLKGAPGVQEGDPSLDLTQENAERLIKRAAQWQCIDSRRPHIDAMREGFQSVLGGSRSADAKPAAQGWRNVSEALAQVYPEELDLLVAGQPWTADLLILNLRFDEGWKDYPKDQELLQEWLFGAFRSGEISPSRFAEFAGRASVPLDGELMGRINVKPWVKREPVAEGSIRHRTALERFPRLPRAHTCSDVVVLPGPPEPAAGGAGAGAGADRGEGRRVFVACMSLALAASSFELK